MTATSIFLTIGVIISFFKVASQPRIYFNGLFRKTTDKEKSDSIYIIIVLLTIIAVPGYFLLNISLKSMDVVAMIVMVPVFLWKTAEILKNPKSYFQGLFERSGDTKTTFEPLAMVLISLLIILAYFFQ